MATAPWNWFSRVCGGFAFERVNVCEGVMLAREGVMKEFFVAFHLGVIAALIVVVTALTVL
jgi:hypothetical protein